MIKTEKTAGTSLEIALSKYLGPDDVVTPISPTDEAVRSGLGFRGPQNHKIPFAQLSRRDVFEAVLKRRRPAFFNHASAAFIKAHVDQRSWDEYYKFAVERNPWDKAVSIYWYRLSRNPSLPSLNQYVESGCANDIRGYDLYSIRNRIVVDRVFRFEDLPRLCEELAEKIRLPEVLQLPHTKTQYRNDRRHYREVLSPQSAEVIGRAYAREIAHFGYVF